MKDVMCKGTFLGCELVPGTFYGGEIEPGTFHGLNTNLADRADKEKKTNDSEKDNSSDDSKPKDRPESDRQREN